jgi:hypothetical protein
MTIALEPSEPVAGEPITFTVTVCSMEEDVLAGTVAISIDGVAVPDTAIVAPTTSDIDGCADWTYTAVDGLPEGPHSVEAWFTPDPTIRDDVDDDYIGPMYFDVVAAD